MEKVKKEVDNNPIITYIYRMKDKEINIKVENITQKQWTNLLIELNLVSESWRPYGPKIKLKAKILERIIKWGRKTHDDKEDRKSSTTVEQNKRSTI